MIDGSDLPLARQRAAGPDHPIVIIMEITIMTHCFKVPLEPASGHHAHADDHVSIERELDAFEAIVRAAHDADVRSATSTLMSDRGH